MPEFQSQVHAWTGSVRSSRLLTGTPRTPVDRLYPGDRNSSDLEQFRTTLEVQLESDLEGLGATVSRFTGQIAVEYAVQDRQAGS